MKYTVGFFLLLLLFVLSFNCDHAIATFVMTFDTTCHIDMDEMGLISVGVAHERAT